MSIFTRKHLIALIAAASLAGCAQKPVADDPGSTGADSDQNASVEGTYGAGDDSVSVGSNDAADNGQQAAKDLAMRATVVYFDFDKSNVRPDAYEILKAHAMYLSGNPAATVRLEGHADERGTREYNLALGERRGNAAANYLTANGVSGSQIEVVSYGEERPAAEGQGEASWAQNRRVELKY